MNIRKVEKAERKALNLIKKEFGEEIDTLFFLFKPDSEKYEQEVKRFKFLFQQKRPEYRMALWNGLLRSASLGCGVKNFTEAEQAFIKRRIDAWNHYVDPGTVNVNKPIPTDRLLLRPTIGDEDILLYHKHLKKDGDFTLFTMLKCNQENIERFGFDRPFYFVIVDRKTKDMIGYVGLRWDRERYKNTGVAEAEYYIFKPHRHKGYAKEALTELCNRAFAGKLLELEETNYSQIYRKRKADIHIIRAVIRADNPASQALVKACGFRHVATLRREYWVAGQYSVDGEIFEVSKE